MTTRFNLAPQPPLPVPAANAYAEAALAASSGPWEGVEEHRDLSFGPLDWQSFDLFTPTNATGSDMLIFVHGGGWTNGYKEWCGFMAPALAARGCALAAVSYRLAPGIRYPAMLEDVLDGISAVIRHLPGLGCASDRVFLSGHSAGGHLAALAALRPDLWTAHGIPERAIRACAPISGILDLHHPAPPPGSLEAMVYEKVLARPEDDGVASPLSWLADNDLPLFLSWGSADSDRVQRANRAARMVLEGAPTPARFLEMDQDHFGTHLALRDAQHPWYDIFDDMRRLTK